MIESGASSLGESTFRQDGYRDAKAGLPPAPPEHLGTGVFASEYMEGYNAAVSEPRTLTLEFVREVLARQDEPVSENHMGHYTSISALAEKVRSSKCWTQGEVFCCAIDADRFIVMKQIAPSSCEMLTLTQNGFQDVITAYRYGQDELVALLETYSALKA